MPALRVAFDARSLTTPVLRGMDRYTVGLARELVRQGVKIALFHRAREPLHGPHLAGLDCEIRGLRDWSGIHWEQVAVPRELRRGRFDVFHAPAERGVPWLAPCPVVLTFHSVTEHSYSSLVERQLLAGPVANYLGYEPKAHRRSFAGWYQRTGVGQAKHILTPSDFARAEVIKFLGVPSSKVTTTYLAVHEQFLRQPKSEAARAETLARLGARPPYLLYVGGYEPHKNVKGLLETFASTRSTRPDLMLVLVGSKGFPDNMAKIAWELDLLPNRDIIFLVNVTDDLTDLYDAAELFVTMSWRETFCLPALEAMTRGVPVVASAWGASGEVVGDGGLLIDPRDHEAAKHAILELLTPDNQTPWKERAGLQAQRFNWSTTANQTLNVYHQLVNG